MKGFPQETFLYNGVLIYWTRFGVLRSTTRWRNRARSDEEKYAQNKSSKFLSLFFINSPFSVKVPVTWPSHPIRTGSACIWGQMMTDSSSQLALKDTGSGANFDIRLVLDWAPFSERLIGDKASFVGKVSQLTSLDAFTMWAWIAQPNGTNDSQFGAITTSLLSNFDRIRD